MSFVIRRSVSTLVPPKVASPAGLSAAKDAVRMARIAKFYEQLPKGPAPEIKPSGLIQRYQARYMGPKNNSAAPIWHAILGIMTLGYSMEYYFHLRHHKNNAH
ncbi:ATP synthase subunit f, mitochondrial [Cyphellophora attinorum]|uniref:ATP synthase subunit f, mitochondrial n=1 Tax=Cyphellophora attinorum TaxID=1664694 RepID=A0A0N1HRM6_9EURO|nr:ATP synthase subunit f, mitochondrial [Phialophora attinorum]KPI38503.1 ATP synthase subunit f, mitochondrial [Phialophora attinorum]